MSRSVWFIARLSIVSQGTSEQKNATEHEVVCECCPVAAQDTVWVHLRS